MQDVAEHRDLGYVPVAAVAGKGSEPSRNPFRTAFPFTRVGGLGEAVPLLGHFPPRLFPPLEAVAAAFVRLTANGTLPHHALDTLVRLIAGFLLAAVVGVG